MVINIKFITSTRAGNTKYVTLNAGFSIAEYLR